MLGEHKGSGSKATRELGLFLPFTLNRLSQRPKVIPNAKERTSLAYSDLLDDISCSRSAASSLDSHCPPTDAISSRVRPYSRSASLSSSSPNCFRSLTLFASTHTQFLTASLMVMP